MNTLFSSLRFSSVVESARHALAGEINSISADTLLGTTLDEWCKFYVSKYNLEPPTLLEDQIQADLQEHRSRTPNIEGSTYLFYVPFHGDRRFFTYTPSTWSSALPAADIQDTELTLSYKQRDPNPDRIKHDFQEDLKQIRTHIERLRQEATLFNRNIESVAKHQLEARLAKIKKDRNIADNLGFPLRKREDAPKTFTVPAIRKQIAIPTVSKKTASAPEPALEMAVYEDILSIISNMTAVMERSPHAFTNMDEETLRQHFLVQLNGQYEGQATGETFNYEGKTDILIRAQGRNIFIGECKFWKGADVFSKTIDQLLGYTAWRDTKTCIVLFNKNKDLTAVLKQIPQLVSSHPAFVRQMAYSSETGFRFIMRHRDDKDRELIMTVLVFDVPG
jgi:hypothetical protein